MKLYLHCGYHKTGSSYLQTMFARNRQLLKESGVWFPKSESEYDMLAGQISPGNGVKLTDALTVGSPEKAKLFLILCREEAEKEGCSTLLISSEGLFHAFAKEGTLENLAHAADECDINTMDALIYFRDPVAHALSVYKHRGKRGTLPEFRNWLDKGYETLDLTESFLEYKDKYPVKWACRKYRKSSQFMVKSAFGEWLGLSDVPEIPIEDKVNESLSLTEIELLRVLNSNVPGMIPHVTNQLRSVPLQQRKSGQSFDHFCEMKASEMLRQKYDQIVNKMNRLLPEGEKLEFPKIVQNEGVENPEGLFLKEKQILALAEAADIYYKSRTVIGRLSIIYSKVANRVRRKLG